MDHDEQHRLRQKIAGWHFAKEALSKGEREILAVAEYLDHALKAAEARVAELEANYQRIIREVLACDPEPASSRADDQLEPPWEVIARIRTRADRLAAALRDVLAISDRNHVAWDRAREALAETRTER